MKKLTVSIIIVTHNHANYIKTCLDSLLLDLNEIPSEVIVVDNCSEDKSADFVKQYSDVKLYSNSNRQGFSANNNFGIAMSSGRYILLLNPDTEVMPGAISTMISFMNSHPKAGMCGAQLLFPDGSIQPSPRRFPTFGSVLSRRTPLRVFLRNSQLNERHLMKDIDHSQIQKVDWLLGACMFIRREILDSVGPLDEGYFLYVEDIDWARRMRNNDWQIFYVPSAKIIHHHLAVSDKKFLSRFMWLHLRSMLLYARKFLVPKIPVLSVSYSRHPVWENALKQNSVNNHHDE